MRPRRDAIDVALESHRRSLYVEDRRCAISSDRALIVYLVALAAAGFWRSRAVRTGDDFLVAGRSLPARVLVFTLLSTWIGSGSLFAGRGPRLPCRVSRALAVGRRVGRHRCSSFSSRRAFAVSPNTRCRTFSKRATAGGAACSARRPWCSPTRRSPPTSFAAADGCCISSPASIHGPAHSSPRRSVSRTPPSPACCRSRISTSPTAS